MSNTTSNPYFVSVVMPAYNAERFIAESIRSASAQTYSSWELIIVDDASSDRTREIALGFAEKDERITVVSNSENLGVTETRKRAIEIAKGPWIAFLDSDDMWEPDKLSKQVDLARSMGIPALLFTGTSYIDEGGRKSSYQLIPPESIDFATLLAQNLVMCSSVLVHQDLLKFDSSIHDGLHEDYAMWLTILKDEPCAYSVPKPLNIYRISSGSKSSNKIKAARMNYRTLRYVGLGRTKAFSSMLKYAGNNIKKYAAIFRGFE